MCRDIMIHEKKKDTKKQNCNQEKLLKLRKGVVVAFWQNSNFRRVRE